MKRLQVDITEKEEQMITDIAHELNVKTKAEVVRKSLKLLHFCVEEWKQGRKVMLEKDGKVTEVVVL